MKIILTQTHTHKHEHAHVYIYICVCVCVCTARCNVSTLNTVKQLLQMSASAAEHNREIICTEEHRFPHCELETKCYDIRKG